MIFKNVPGRPSRKPATHPLAVVFLSAILLYAVGPAGPAGAGEDRVPAWRNLTPQEARRFVDQGIDEPATHLLGQAADRAAGAVTELRVVAVLVDFPDLPADRVQHSREYFEQLLFSRGELPNRSVAEYLSRSSAGRLELSGEVRGWFTVPQNHTYYTNGYSGIGYFPRNSQSLAVDAFLLANGTINYAHFDNEGADGVPDSGDDDELVDGFLVIHAGPGREAGGTGPDDFISLFWYLPKTAADGVFGRYFTLTSEEGNIGVILHEMGHLLGLPDLYDTDGGSFGLGAWSMMAGGSNLEEGRRPADFDPWCKTRLGFADVINISQNAKQVPIAPTVDSGVVYRLWREGVLGQEYFLLENRRQSGLDAALPGQGLLIFHVDESLNNNRNPNHYRVALEQADGLYQLENRFGDPSFGDAGDPFAAGDAFGRYTIPNSTSYEGSDSFVHVFNLSEPDSAGVVSVDFSVNAGPLVEVADINPAEITGNGDGLLSPGELIGIAPRITISRAPAGNLKVVARSLDPLGVLLDQEFVIGTVPPNQTVTLADPFRIQVSPDIPSDPYGLGLQLELAWDDAPGRIIPVELGIGSVVGRDDTFENPDHGWTHAQVRPSAPDQWTYGATVGEDGSAGFRYGYFNGGFRRGSDAVLVSPPVLLPANARLLFDHRIDVHNPDSLRVQAGGVIEISVNGSDWQVAFPEGGYPRTFYGDHVDWFGRPMFSGPAPAPDFATVRVDLSQYTGALRVRFRFFSEVEVRIGTGWIIDNVRVINDVTPVRVLSASAAVAGNDVELRWELAAPLPSRLRWRRGPTAASAVPVTDWLTAFETGAALDPGGASALPSAYWMEALDRAGETETWGPLAATAGEGSRRPWRLLANPSRSLTRFAWNAPLSGDARIEIFDVRGRLVASGPAGATGTYAWDGRDHAGRPSAPGIYFARIRDAGPGARAFPPLRVVRLP
jgi:immune inhibitor A